MAIHQPSRNDRAILRKTCTYDFQEKGLRWCYIASAVFLLQTSEAFGILDRLVYGEWADKPGDKITVGLNLLMIITSLLLFWRAKRIGAGGISYLRSQAFCFSRLHGPLIPKPPSDGAFFTYSSVSVRLASLVA